MQHRRLAAISRPTTLLLLAALGLAACTSASTPSVESGAATADTGTATSPDTGTATEPDTGTTTPASEPTDSAGTPAAPAQTAPAKPQSAPPFQANTLPDSDENYVAGPVVVTDIRFGRHEGFDRLVIELGGSGQAGWLAQYVDNAATAGAGDIIQMPGDGVLDVRLDHVWVPGDAGIEHYAGPRQFRVGGGVMLEVYNDPVYEGHEHILIGVEEPRPFRVYRMSGPQRVVVEILHQG